MARIKTVMLEATWKLCSRMDEAAVWAYRASQTISLPIMLRSPLLSLLNHWMTFWRYIEFKAYHQWIRSNYKWGAEHAGEKAGSAIEASWYSVPTVVNTKEDGGS